jgi:hypothetical protein
MTVAVAIPEMNDDGLLPPGCHRASVAERQPIDGLRELRERLESGPGSDTPSVQLMMRALDRQIREADLARRGVLDITLEGLSTGDDAIDVDLLARFLDTLQHTVTSVGQALVGEPTRRGAIRGDIRKATSLSLAATFSGSFGLHLTTAEPELQPDQFEGSHEVLERSLASVLETLDVAVEGNGDAVREHAAALGPRAFARLQSLVHLLAAEGVTASFEWRSATRVLTSTVTSAQLSRAREALSTTTVAQNDVVVVGRLVGASLVRGRFELETSTGIILAGAIDPNLLERVADYFGEECQATLRMTTVHSLAERSENASYVLLNLA